MKNKILLIGVFVFMFGITTTVLAVGPNNTTSNKDDLSEGVHEPGTGLVDPELKEEGQGTGQGLLEGNAGIDSEIKNQNQIRNEGEESQIQNKEKEGIEDEGDNEDIDEKGEKSAMSLERRSQVANAVQEMLSLADKNGGIGQEIKVIAQAQNQNQEKIEDSLIKAQSRSGFAKFFIGPKDTEINNTKELLAQKQEQVKQLVELKNQLKNEGDQKTLEEQIKILEQANLEIEVTLEKEQKGFSLFGWLFK